MRGAAVLGGVFLAIAGFLFLQHAIEHQWITAKTRVLAATIAGVACFAGSFPLRKRGYAITASAIAGAGSVVLYAAAWAASMLYGFIEPMTAFAAMGGVTAACIALAWAHRSQLIAVLGLVGGFATPLVLSTGTNRPLGLFGYVLLLDLAFLFLSGKRRWPAIGFIALVGTTLLQGLWIFARMDPDEAWIGLGVLGLFALLFAFFAASRGSEDRRSWIPAQTGSLFLPFAFVLYFAQDLALEVPLGALALLAALLTAAACVLARRERTPWLPIGAASGSVALLLVWAVAHEHAFDATTSLVLAACAVGIAGLTHAFAEWKSKDGTHAAGSVAGAGTSALGMLLVAAYAAVGPGDAQPWPWLACFGVLALATQRQAALAGRDSIAFAGALGAGAALALQRALALGALRVDRDVPIVLAALAIGVSLLVAARARAERARSGAFFAAASFFVTAPFAFWSSQSGAETTPHATLLALGALLAIASLALAAASGTRSAAAYVVFAVLVFLLQASEVGSSGVHDLARSSAWAGVLALLAATTVLFGAWPFLARSSWRDSALAWRTAAFQPVAWIFPVAALVEARHGQALAFATPLVFAWGSATQALALWRAPIADDERGRRVQTIARVASTSVALLFLAAVAPVHVDIEPFALTMVLFGAALAVFWARVDSRATKWVAVVAFTLAALRLVLGRASEAFTRPEHLVWNQHAYLYLLPALCAVVASLRLRSHEVERARGFEGGLYRSQKAFAAGYVGLLAIAFAFVWLNVEIASRYAVGDQFWLARAGEPGRPLAMSIGWAVYALLLLALGIVRGAAGPRWVSLALFLVTIAKVFLFDLGHLAGLQRAASMLGLAVSLLVVSLVYQRFVFRRTKDPAHADAPSRQE